MSVLPMRQVSGGHSLNTVPARIPQPRTTGYPNNGADLRLSGATGLSVIGTSQSVSEEAPPPIQVPSSDSSSPGLFEAPPGVPVIPGHTGVTNPVTTTNVQQWSFNFQNAPWVTVLRTFAREAGYSLQLAADPNGDFTFYDENLYSAVQVLDIFNDHLMSNGHILVREGNRLTLTSATADIPGNLIPFVAIQRLDSLGRKQAQCGDSTSQYGRSSGRRRASAASEPARTGQSAHEFQVASSSLIQAAISEECEICCWDPESLPEMIMPTSTSSDMLRRTMWRRQFLISSTSRAAAEEQWLRMAVLFRPAVQGPGSVLSLRKQQTACWSGAPQKKWEPFRG